MLFRSQPKPQTLHPQLSILKYKQGAPVVSLEKRAVDESPVPAINHGVKATSPRDPNTSSPDPDHL